MHRADTGAPSRHAPSPTTLRTESLAHLRALLRIDSSNPPGNEIEVARYLAGVFDRDRIAVTLLEPSPGRATVMARLQGNGSARPLLLLAHMDVVGADREGWSVDPFGADFRDGFVYGRGAIDDKGMLAANLMAMVRTKREVLDAGGALTRDLVFLATSDEEGGGAFGIDWVIAHRPELVDAEFALNEGGRIRIVGGRTLYCAVQCAEKVSHLVELVAHGNGGHAAIPLSSNCIVRLGQALSKIGQHREPTLRSPVTGGFFGALANVWPDATLRSAMTDVASGNTAAIERGALVLAAVPVFDAVLRNGISAVGVRGGVRSNVIPTEARATLNIRTLPGESLDVVVERLRVAINTDGVEIVVRSRGREAPVSDPASPMFQAIADALGALDPSIAVAPYLSTGATDSAALRRHGVQCYGVLPFPLEQGDEERMHGHDERIRVSAFDFGVDLVTGIVRRMTT